MAVTCARRSFFSHAAGVIPEFPAGSAPFSSGVSWLAGRACGRAGSARVRAARVFCKWSRHNDDCQQRSHPHQAQAYDYRILDKAVAEIVDTARNTGAGVAGPIPLPTNIHKYTIQRSVHGNKKSREQFEMRIHKRLMDILEPTQQTVDALGKLCP